MTPTYLRGYVALPVSIHTPVKGVTTVRGVANTTLAGFNPHTRKGCDDTDLSYRLYRDGIPFHRIEINTIHKGNQSFRKINNRNPLSGYYNVEDWSNNVRYLYQKYFHNDQN